MASSWSRSQLLSPSHPRPLSPHPCRERASMRLSQIPARQPKPAGRLIAVPRPVTQSHGCPPGQGGFFIPGCQRGRKAVTHFEGCQQVACLKKQALNKYAGPGAMFCCLTLSPKTLTVVVELLVWGVWKKKTGSREPGVMAKTSGKASRRRRNTKPQRAWEMKEGGVQSLERARAKLPLAVQPC